MEIVEEKLRDPSVNTFDKEKMYGKVEKMQETQELFEGFSSFIDEEKWNQRFEIPLKNYLDGLVDPCIKLFIGLNA